MTEVRRIRWIDSSLPKPTVIESVGFVVDETDEYVTLARDDMGDGDYRGLCVVPKIALLAAREKKEING